MRCAKAVCLFATLFLLMSCSIATKMYSGPELPNSQVAIIHRSVPYFDIIFCDDKQIKPTSSISVLPGIHTIGMVPGGFFRIHVTGGHTYVVDHEPYKNGLDVLFIRDKLTGERVSVPLTKKESDTLDKKIKRSYPR